MILLLVLVVYLSLLASSKSKEINSEINSIMNEEAVLFYRIDNFISKAENTITEIGVFIRENHIAKAPSKPQDFENFINLEKLEVYFKKNKNKSSKLNVYLFDSTGKFVIGTQNPSKALSDYALIVKNDNQDDIIRSSLINDSWVL